MKSWIESANDPTTDFPLANLPFGVFQDGIGVAIGDFVLTLGLCAQAGFLDGLSAATIRASEKPVLNDLMALSSSERIALRARLTELLTAGQKQREGIGILLVPMRDAVMRRPADTRDYTDFYASIFHAENVGRLFRPDNPLLPNYKYVPIGYHGRASSLVVGGTRIHRPQGQIKMPDADAPVFAPTRSLDFELEIGMYVGQGNALGQTIPIDEAGSHIFGFSLVNDWSARDVQAWEYQPLGPFLGKSFATSVSPWVVTTEALEPFRSPAFARPEGDPPPLPYLDSPEDRRRGAFDITLEVYLASARMREEGTPEARIGRSRFRDLYWTPAQLITHHASNGCNLQTGDLLASGTVSGEAPDSRGCLLELTRRGAEPIALPSGETRKFLEDGDEVILRGYCEREGHARIGFGECRGIVSA
ncbi:MAG TPA: fumarylacetoacetase [Bryobacteraceae bacterium]|nr:fumarylacetoacetase [Bryobacteraceae bacterium]